MLERSLSIVQVDLERRGWSVRRVSPDGPVLVAGKDGVERLVAVVAARYPDDPRAGARLALPAHWLALVQLTRNLEPIFAPSYLQPGEGSPDAHLPAPVEASG